MNKDIINNVHKVNPLVHNITNYVTVNDCANVLLACGGSPIMSDDINDVYDITTICSALNINIGTLNERTIESMIVAGKRSNELGHVVCLDPVGNGASAFRTNTVNRLLENIKFDVIKGNASEIRTIFNGFGNTKGVDVDENDAVNEDNIYSVSVIAKELAAKTGAIIIITGVIDVVADKDTAYAIKNGHSLMSKISGTGCMLSAMLGAYLASNKDNKLEAAVACVGVMGVAGERAVETAISKNAGSGSLRTLIIDEIYKMTDESLEEGLNAFVVSETKADDSFAKKMIRNAMKVYIVTDRSWLNGESLYEQVEKALKGGATFVQVREKSISDEEFIRIAKDIKQLTDKYNVPLVINDNVDVALAVGADGVHVGQSDMDSYEVRKLLGEDKIIGVSAHNLKEAKKAVLNGADYLGVGAVFATTSKDDAEAVSMETLKEICDNVEVPVVAIGGIKKDNICTLKNTGIDGVAVISAVFAADDITKATEDIYKEVINII